MSAVITYRKTKAGEWVAFGPAAALQAAAKNGTWITVSKKSGGADKVLLDRTGRVFTAHDAEMVYGYPAVTETGAGAPAAPAAQTREEAEALLLQMSTMDLHAVAQSARDDAARARRRARMCESCGERRAVTTATDMSGITGSVCRICAQDEGHGLSLA